MLEIDRVLQDLYRGKPPETNMAQQSPRDLEALNP